ncbi:hypothetical protein JW979_07400, partial [bacterium]|nr:hypothetical protein [candidate division CSSED10-310 bacterium]
MIIEKDQSIDDLGKHINAGYNKILSIVDDLDLLYEKTDDNESFSSELPYEVTQEIKKLIRSVSNTLRQHIDSDYIDNRNNLFEVISQDVSDSRFVEALKSAVERYDLPYNETAFIRNMEQSEKKAFLNLIYKHAITSNNTFGVMRSMIDQKYTDEQIEVGIRVINTVVKFYLNTKCSLQRFNDQTYRLFGFNAEDLLDVYTITKKNRMELQM